MDASAPEMHEDLPPSNAEGAPESKTLAPVTAGSCANRGVAVIYADPVGTLGYR